MYLPNACQETGPQEKKRRRKPQRRQNPQRSEDTPLQHRPSRQRKADQPGGKPAPKPKIIAANQRIHLVKTECEKGGIIFYAKKRKALPLNPMSKSSWNRPRKPWKALWLKDSYRERRSQRGDTSTDGTGNISHPRLMELCPQRMAPTLPAGDTVNDSDTPSPWRGYDWQR